MTGGASRAQPSPGRVGVEPKHVKVFVEGDTSDIPKFIKVAQEKAPERSLSFEFTRDKEAEWDIRVVLSAEGSARGRSATEEMNGQGRCRLGFTNLRSDLGFGRVTGYPDKTGVMEEWPTICSERGAFDHVV